MGLLAVLMVATLPVFVTNLKATALTKTHTQAKNLSQQRLDQLRNLRFHVDRQNGPFLDLLDMYYTNATPGAAATTVTSGGVTLTGQYVASGAAAGGLPAAPYFRVTTGALPGAPDFSQTIAAQFLSPSGAALSPTIFESKYDSQVVGKDQPPSLMLGVTVITHWTVGGVAKSYRTYSRITDGRPQQPLLQSQTRAIALDVSSTAADGSTLTLQAGVVSLDGAQSSGSSVSGSATGALASRTGAPTVNGLVSQFSWPTPGGTTSGSTNAQDGGSCSWYGFGKTGTDNVTGSIAGGLPKAPNNVDAATPPNVVRGYIIDNGGGTCGQVAYDNLAGGGVPVSGTVGDAIGAAPYVQVPNASGTSASLIGAGYVTSNPDAASPTQTRSGAAASMTSKVKIFPNNPDAKAAGHALVEASLTAASVNCTSGTGGSPGTVSAAYTLELGWWGAYNSEPAKWHTATWTYSSAGGAPVHSGDTWDPANTTVASMPLEDLVTMSGGGTPAVVDTGADLGLRGFPTGILTLTTTSTLGNEPQLGYSAINVTLGQLTCVADDLR
jgi:hypothetical protein